MTNIYRNFYGEVLETVINPFTRFGKNVRLGFNVVIDKDVTIGENVFVGHNTVIRSGVEIGNNTVIGHLVMIESDTKIGDFVTIQSQCHITKLAKIHSRVFMGPKAMCINTHNISHGRKFEAKLEGPILQYGVRIGSGAIVMPGITIRNEAVLGAGAVATKDIPAFQIWMGIPAKYIKDVPKEELL